MTKRKKKIEDNQLIEDLFEFVSLTLILFAEATLQKEKKEKEIREESLHILEESDEIK
jgi:hypothetical protein